jgi:hypothetical protein
MLGLCIARYAVTHRARVLLVAAALLLLFACGLSKLELATDGRTLLDPRAPQLAIDGAVRARHEVSDPLVVLLTAPDGVLTTAHLGREHELGARLRALPGVARVHGLHSLAVFDAGRGRLRPFFTPEPAQPAHAFGTAERGELLAQLPHVERWLVSADRKSACLHVDLAAGADRTVLCRAVLVQARALFPAAMVAGAPVVEAMLGDAIVRDLARTVPLALLASALVLWLCFASVAGVLVPLLTVGSALLATLGGAGFAGVPLTLASTVLPVVLLTSCLGDVVHLVHRVATLRAAHPQRAPADVILAALRGLHRALAYTTWTTTAGFLSFALSPLPALRDFGLLAAAGALLALAATFALAPALLATCPLPVSAPGARGSATRTRTPPRAPRRTLAAAALLAVGALLCASRIEVRDRWIDNFAHDSPLRGSHAHLDAEFLPAHRLLLALQLEEPLDPDGMARLAEFTARVAAQAPVVTMRSLLDLVRVAQAARRAPSPWPASLGALREDLLWLGAFDPHTLRTFLDRDQVSLLVHVFVHDADDKRVRGVIEHARLAAASLGLRLAVAGDAALSTVLVSGLVTGQIASLSCALAAVLVLGVLLWRSRLLGLLQTVPVALAALGVYGALGLLGIPLGVATSMFGSLAVGIGVDAAVHWLVRWRRERARPGATPGAAIACTRAAVEPAIARSTMVLIAGFAVLTLSSVPPNRRLGGLLALALALAWLATRHVLPALVAAFAVRPARAPDQLSR